MKSVSAEEFERLFDEGADLTPYLDESTFCRPGYPPKRISVDMPRDVVAMLDRRAKRMGITRQALIKTWLFDRLMEENDRERKQLWAAGKLDDESGHSDPTSSAS